MPISLDVTMKERYLAIVLLDLIGSTQFVQRVGAVKAAQWFQFHDRLARSLTYKYAGREIDRSDGFLLSFEKVGDAVSFALKYQETIPPKTKLQCRIGIHWGRIIEVQQDDVYVGAGAKRVELEGLAKNIAARTMSLCQAGQVLLTKEAHLELKNRLNPQVPKTARVACVGMYRFKGVREPQEIFAIGTDIKTLQPPPSSEKVKRLGGPKYIKSRARDRKLMEWVWWFMWRLAIIETVAMLIVFTPVIVDPHKRWVLGIHSHVPFIDDYFAPLYWAVINFFTKLLGG